MIQLPDVTEGGAERDLASFGLHCDDAPWMENTDNLVILIGVSGAMLLCLCLLLLLEHILSLIGHDRGPAARNHER